MTVEKKNSRRSTTDTPSVTGHHSGEVSFPVPSTGGGVNLKTNVGAPTIAHTASSIPHLYNMTEVHVHCTCI